jgi:hypothetical protein
MKISLLLFFAPHPGTSCPEKMRRKPKKILFLLLFPPGKAPSQRFRAEAFFPFLQQHGYRVVMSSFYGAEAWQVLYGQSSAFAKAWVVAKGFLKRIYHALFVVPFCDFVFVQRGATPIGPPALAEETHF